MGHGVLLFNCYKSEVIGACQQGTVTFCRIRRHNCIALKNAMNDKELIRKIELLKEVKPKQEWVALTKARIFEEEPAEHRFPAAIFLRNFAFQYRMALSVCLAVGLMAGTLILAEGALPGDPLYPVKKTAEKGMAMLVNKDQKPTANLALAEKRLEELNKVSEKNLVQNLPTAFKEYKDAKVAAKREVAALVRQNPEKAGEIVKKISPAMKDIDNKEKEVWTVLGIGADASSTEEIIGDASDDQIIVESLIGNFEGMVLTNDQQSDLTKVKELSGGKRYQEALEFYLNSSLNK